MAKQPGLNVGSFDEIYEPPGIKRGPGYDQGPGLKEGRGMPDLRSTTAIERVSFKKAKKKPLAERRKMLQPQKIGTGEVSEEEFMQKYDEGGYQGPERRKKKSLKERRKALQPQKIGTGEVDAED